METHRVDGVSGTVATGWRSCVLMLEVGPNGAQDGPVLIVGEQCDPGACKASVDASAASTQRAWLTADSTDMQGEQ